MSELTLRVSVDITEADLEQLGPITTLDPRNNNTRDDDQRAHQTPLAVDLTGYHLLNMAVILAFGIPKAVLSYRGESVMPTTLDLLSGTFLAVILYYVGLLKDKRPEICPSFFQVDLAPPILKFIYLHRSKFLLIILYLISWPPAEKAVKSMQAARRRAKARDQISPTVALLLDTCYYLKSKYVILMVSIAA
ncbi:hypothetical protein BJV74DRAFT_796472 [Russula compacta]|nr:hypothetical protein BJV74DRAFT_796472 [Russula compacta]